MGDGTTLTRGADHFKKFVSRGRLRRRHPWLLSNEEELIVAEEIAPSSQSVAVFESSPDVGADVSEPPLADQNLQFSAGTGSLVEDLETASEETPVISGSASVVGTGFDVANTSSGTAPVAAETLSQVARLQRLQTKVRSSRSLSKGRKTANAAALVERRVAGSPGEAGNGGGSVSRRCCC